MDISNALRKCISVFATIAAMTLLANCGGGSNGGAATPVFVSGLAAAGAPITSATVTLKDSAGHSSTAMTTSTGAFQLTVTGFTAPFLLSVSSGGKTLYSYAGHVGDIANLTPYSSVILAAYYKALGSTISSTFAGTPTSSSFPDAQQLVLLVQPVVNALQPYLIAAGVSQPNQFNPFSSTFVANHSGVDQVLDRTTLPGTDLLSFTVDNGSGSTPGAIASTVTETITAGSTNTPAQVAVTINTSNSNNSSTSSSQQTVPVGTNGTQQSDLADAQSGVLTLFSALRQLVATKPGTIAATDVAPYVDAAFLDRGKNASKFEQQLASFLNGIPSNATFTPSIDRVTSFNDGTPETLATTVRIDVTSNGTTTTNYVDNNDNLNSGFVFKKESSGSWEFYGGQTIADAHVNIAESSLYDANSGTPNTPTIGLDMQTQVNVATAALTAVSISGPANSLPDCSMTPSPLTKSTITLSKDSGSFNGDDRYDLSCSMTDAGALSGAPPAAGTEYTFQLTEASSSVVNQNDVLNAATTDNGTLTQINGTARASYSGTAPNVAGTTLTLTWTPPTSYAIAYSYLNAFCQNAAEVSGGGGADSQGTLSNIPPGTNTGTIGIPSQCDGAAVAGLGITVNFVGVNGERSMVTQNLHM